MTGGPSFGGAAVSAVHPGSYGIHVSDVSSLSAGNYAFAASATDGTLTIDQAPTIITWSNPPAIVYGTPLSASQLDATASVAGTFAYSPSVGTVLNGGSGQVLSATFTPTDSIDYTSPTATVAINVLPAQASFTNLSGSQSIIYGAPSVSLSGALPAGTSGMVHITIGSTTIGTAIHADGTFGTTFDTASLAASATPYAITYSYAGDGNFQAAPDDISTTLAVAKADQTIRFGSLTAKTFGDADFTLVGSATSGLALVYLVKSGPATVSGDTVHLTGAGTVVIEATQPGDASNNAASAVDQSFSVGLATPSINLITDGGTFVYDGTGHGATATVAGVGGVDLGLVSLSYFVGMGTTGAQLSAAPVNVGNYTVEASFAGNSNYLAATQTSLLVISPRSLTITVDDASKVYGQTIGFDGTEIGTVGLVTGDSVNDVVLTSPGASATAGVAGSPYLISASGATGVGLSNYTINYVSGALTVSKAHLLVVADDLSTAYDGTGFVAGDATATFVNFVNGQDATTAGITGLPTFSGSAIAAVNVGVYSIQVNDVSGLSAANYDFMASPVAATVTITQASQQITFPPLVTRTYGDADFVVNEATDSSGLPISYAIKSGPATIAGNLVHILGAGVVTIEATQAGDANFAAASAVDQTFTIARATPTVTVGGGTFGYDGTAHGAASGSVTFVVQGDLGIPSFTYFAGTGTGGTRLASAPVNAGVYTVEASYPGSSNFNAVSSLGTIQINPKAATITPSASGKIYGGADPGLTGVLSGFLPADGVTATFTRTSGEDVTGGPYVISASANPNASLANYAITTSTANFVISPRPVSLTLGNLSASYDGHAHYAVATSTPAITGVSVTYSLAGVAVASPTTAGSYAVTATITDPNDVGNPATGTLVIAKASPTIVWTPPTSIIYGTPLSATQLDAAATIPGLLTYSPSAGTILSVGSQTLTVDLTPIDSTDYADATLSVPLAVVKAQETFTGLMAPQSIAYGQGSVNVAGHLSTPGASASGQQVTINVGSSTAYATVQPDGSFSAVLVTHELAASSTPYTISYSTAGNVGFLPANDASTSLTVNRAGQVIVFVDAPSGAPFGTTFHVNPTSSAGLPVSLTGQYCTVTPSTGGGFDVTVTSGSNPAILTATQAGDANHSAASAVTVDVDAQQLPASVTLDPSSLSVTADGNPHYASATTSPGNLDVRMTYSQNGNVVYGPTAPGSYNVTATIADPNYRGNATATLVIKGGTAAEPPQATGVIATTHSRKKLTSITIGFDQALDASSAANSAHFTLLGAVRRGRKVTYKAKVFVGTIGYNAGTHSVTINLSRAFRGAVQVTVHPGVAGSNGVDSTQSFAYVAS